MFPQKNRPALILACALLFGAPGWGLFAPPLSAAQTVAAAGSAAPSAQAPTPPKTVAWSDKPAPAAEAPAPPMSPADRALVALGLVLGLAALFTVPRVVPALANFLNSRYNPWAFAEAIVAATRNLAGEDPALVEFFSALRASLKGPLAYSLAEAPGASPSLAQGAEGNPLQDFLAAAPRRLARLRTLLSKIGRLPDNGDRQKMIFELFDRLDPIKEASRLPALLPVWQLAAALEGLLKQLTAKASSVTPSTLRTVAGALDLLEALCVPGLKPDLATNPPVRLLAVDDDPISRHAIAFALKKAFEPPDLAANGKGGLDLAARQTYDVIFLDVEMPVMDGFELCSKIRETVPNRNTPVVFVTSHTDFNSRAKSTVIGGQDLIGKPFLAFELTVKALTLVLRGRLDSGSTIKPRSSRREEAHSLPAPAPHLRSEPSRAASSERMPHEGEAACRNAPPASPSSPQPAASGSPIGQIGDACSPVSANPTPQDFAEALLTHAPVHLEQLRNRLRAAIAAPDQGGLGDFLGELYVGVHWLSTEAERAELRAVHKLGFALEGLLKKILEKPALRATPSALHAAAAALELLERLCLDGSNPSLSEPPIRLLAVDDDPIARRAICGALQLVFGRPASADSGETALALASESAFDLIFLDVMMPGMDGYAACAKIHETALNAQTPVVFVTSHHDRDSRAQAEAAGGCGFIPKPVLSSEIVLTALTFILRGRLERGKTPQSAEPVAEAAR